MADLSDGLLNQIYRCLVHISGEDSSITPDRLAKLYASAPKIFTKRKMTIKGLDPATVAAWRRMCTAENDPDGVKALIKAVQRTRYIAQDLGVDTSDLTPPLELEGCRQCLATISDRFTARYAILAASNRTKAKVGGRSNVPVQTLDVVEAIKHTFGLGDRDIRQSDVPLDRYYGYRRSANSGEIVRFSVELREDPSTGLLEFDNYYNRHPDQWIVSGIGFAVKGDVTHLFGNAKSSPTSQSGKGIRFFTLQAYEFRWLVGLLDSRDNNGRPISARIVLVPADQHKEGKDHGFDPTNESFLHYLADGNNRSKLADEIEVDTSLKHRLNGLKEIELILSLIWNGSIRALHGEPQAIPRLKEKRGLTRLIEIQERMLSLKEQPPNDVYLFMRLLADDHIYDAIDHSLKVLERMSSRQIANGEPPEPPKS